MSEGLYNTLGTLSVLLNFSAIIQSLQLGYKLYRSPSPLRKANRILALLLIVFSVITLNSVIIFTGYSELLSFYQNYSNASILIIGPAIYLYLAWITITLMPKRKQAYHFVPFLLYFLLILVFQLLRLTDKPSFEHLHNVMFIVFNIQIVTYLSLSFVLMKKYRIRLINALSNVDSLLYNWVNNILYGFLLIYLLVLGTNFYEVIFGRVVTPLIKLNFVLIWSFQIIYLSSKSLKLTTLAPIKIEKGPRVIIEPSTSKELLANARIILESELLFTNPNLTLNDLSYRIGTSSRYLSAAINGETTGGFFDFINGYRIQLVIERMRNSDYNHLSLLGIASECGFQSSSTFNIAFKKQMGMPPSEYRRKFSVA